MSIEEFFGGLWEWKKDRETTGHETEPDAADTLASPEEEYDKYEKTAEVEIYRLVEEQSSFDDNTKELFQHLKTDILGYYRTMSELERVTLTDGSNEDVSKSDQARRFAHNALIDTLNSLSRYAGNNGLDNEWRRVIGLDRTQVTRWVKKVAPYLILKEGKN